MPNRCFLPGSLQLSLVVFLILAVASVAAGMDGKVVRDDDGTAVAGAQVTVLGRALSARTDQEGRFTLTPDPSLPFELLVSLPGGRYMKPVLVEGIPDDGILIVRVMPVLFESVTVTAGVAPNIQSTPASGMTLLSETEIEIRQPGNLTEALENVPGVFSISEGQAAVPAIRGLAQGRSLIMIDGARVTSERRVGPSATYLDPFVLEGLEVSRGPGSVAYGSDAFGGVILARTRRPAPGGPLKMRFMGAAGAGIPQARTSVEVQKGVSPTSGLLFQAHYRNAEDYTSPEGEVFNSGASDYGFLGRFEQATTHGLFSFGLQSDFGRDIERPRTNSHITRFYYPTEDSNRFTASYDMTPDRRIFPPHLRDFFRYESRRHGPGHLRDRNRPAKHRTLRRRGQGFLRPRDCGTSLERRSFRVRIGLERQVRIGSHGCLHRLRFRWKRKLALGASRHRKRQPRRYGLVRELRERSDLEH